MISAPSKPQSEFIALMAMLMSMVALSIDAMLPALQQIGHSLGVDDPNQTQLIVGSVFLGLAFGQMFYGPLSDAIGRKPAIFIGVGIFLVGAFISGTAQTFDMMLLGRILQGAGAASCRVVTLAMIRDRFSGPNMARVMSLIMLMFILVPAIAPSVGQGILFIAEWRAIFWVLFGFGLIGSVWLALRQPETLAIENRVPLSVNNIISGIKQTLGHPTASRYTLAGGIMFGAFVGYLSSSQQIIQIQYDTGPWFALLFGLLALGVGLSSFANSRLVMRFSLEKLCIAALSLILFSSSSMMITLLVLGHDPSLLSTMVFLISVFCAFGILFGNFNALAVHPLGHIAGMANSVISTVQTLISVLIGSAIGQSYDGSILPLTIGFFFCSLLTLFIVLNAQKYRQPAATTP